MGWRLFRVFFTSRRGKSAVCTFARLCDGSAVASRRDVGFRGQSLHVFCCELKTQLKFLCGVRDRLAVTWVGCRQSLVRSILDILDEGVQTFSTFVVFMLLRFVSSF